VQVSMQIMRMTFLVRGCGQDALRCCPAPRGGYAGQHEVRGSITLRKAFVCSVLRAERRLSESKGMLEIHERHRMSACVVHQSLADGRQRSSAAYRMSVLSGIGAHICKHCD